MRELQILINWEGGATLLGQSQNNYEDLSSNNDFCVSQLQKAKEDAEEAFNAISEDSKKEVRNFITE